MIKTNISAFVSVKKKLCCVNHEKVNLTNKRFYSARNYYEIEQN